MNLFLAARYQFRLKQQQQLSEKNLELTREWPTKCCVLRHDSGDSFRLAIFRERTAAVDGPIDDIAAIVISAYLWRVFSFPSRIQSGGERK